MAYRPAFDAITQIELEELIAAFVFDHPNVETDEETAADIGRRVLLLVVGRLIPEWVD